MEQWFSDDHQPHGQEGGIEFIRSTENVEHLRVEECIVLEKYIQPILHKRRIVLSHALTKRRVTVRKGLQLAELDDAHVDARRGLDSNTKSNGHGHRARKNIERPRAAPR